MKIYAMSDIHGCIAEFDEALSLIDLSGENMLILCGDYIHGYDSYSVLDRIIALQRRYGEDKVIALMGNHEEMVTDGRWRISEFDDETDYDEAREDRYIQWMCDLPRYYTTDTQIFVHAGVCEEDGELWEETTDDYTYTEKFPAQTGSFCMDIIAGHVGTAVVADNPRFHDIYYDGQSHYYIDGSVLDSGVIPVLMYDCDKEEYYQLYSGGAFPIEAYEE